MTRLVLLATLALLCACQSGSPAPTKAEPTAEPAATSGWQTVASARLDPPVDSGPGETYAITAIAPDAGPPKKDASAPKR